MLHPTTPLLLLFRFSRQRPMAAAPGVPNIATIQRQVQYRDHDKKITQVKTENDLHCCWRGSCLETLKTKPLANPRGPSLRGGDFRAFLRSFWCRASSEREAAFPKNTLFHPCALHLRQLVPHLVPGFCNYSELAPKQRWNAARWGEMGELLAGAPSRWGQGTLAWSGLGLMGGWVAFKVHMIFNVRLTH